MSSSPTGAPVFITGRLGVPFLQRIKNLLPAAITRAIQQTLSDMKSTILFNPFIIPRLTGALQQSVVMFVSPGQIVFQWSAKDGIYDYAKIRDEKGGILAPPGFSKRVLALAKEFLMKNLIFELGAMRP